MTILALEFSSDRRSVALARDGIVLSEAVEQTGGRATKAFGLIEKVLAEGKVSRESVEVIAVGLGPGSYTGIRAAISVAQGWQLARGVKLLGVGSMEALAAQAQAEKIFGRVRVVVDAQRGEFYLGEWDISADELVATCPVQIVSGAEISKHAGAGGVSIGPTMERLMYPAAAMVARLAGGREAYVPGEGLQPIYLRETSYVKAPASRPISS
ncbi:MAG TPA: tRNA (adenosine(37)-N6)-threonylcarbamoyltransferase complex dimerization subunit type 1 TsaB [Candidatus Acidoferrales bacterium]|jgi:tRNA threonylcarbamoyladenosine biosynthesis protein TsaB|nr:tRNA (adenosine(37)-N6)-threonylcarbamoyltransferase complex dimerization subunit type 1 TsaB [Candidatus Acidoferrales bacterium]